MTLEGRIVRLSDKIAYIHHDMDDAIRAGILTEADVPREIGEVIGFTTGERLDHFIHDIVSTSYGKDDIMMSPPVAEAMKKLRAFMFERVYKNKEAKSEEGADPLQLLSSSSGTPVGGYDRTDQPGRTGRKSSVRLHRSHDRPFCHS